MYLVVCYNSIFYMYIGEIFSFITIYYQIRKLKCRTTVFLELSEHPHHSFGILTLNFSESRLFQQLLNSCSSGTTV